MFDAIHDVDVVAQSNSATITEHTENLDQINDVIEPYVNIANPSDLVTGSVWSQVNYIYSAEGWSRQEIAVKAGKKYTVDGCATDFCWFTNNNNDNLGHFSAGIITVPSGCTKIRLGKQGTTPFVVLNIELDYLSAESYDDFPYGTTFAKISTDIDNIKSRLEIVENEIFLPEDEYTSVSLFETMGVCGDSYSSGLIVGVTGGESGTYYSISWPQILARKVGIMATNYSEPGFDVSACLSDSDPGLPALKSDTAKNLYVIMLGINSEKKISDPTETAEIGTVNDIDISDPTNNADTFCGHYGTMISAIMDHAPNAKIILVKPLEPMIHPSKNTAIGNIGNLFGIPVISLADDPFYSTSFYTDNLHTSHPIGITYAGMANAFERQIALCMKNNASYFTVYPVKSVT